MARSNAPLRVVKGADCYDPRDPEAELIFLFAQEAQLARQLGATRAAIYAARERYRADAGLMMLPRYELLRERYGPKP
jgi:hypothetical protein